MNPRRSYSRWCCLCGARDPKPLEVRPVSDHEMKGRGLQHLTASAVYASALERWETAAPARQVLGITTQPPAR